MNAYAPCTVYSSIDEQGRYAYGNQPRICQWNLARFAETLLPLLAEDIELAVEVATEAIGRFPAIYQQQWLAGMRGKLGWADIRDDDLSLVEQLLRWLEQHQRDYTNTFHDLTARPDRLGGYADQNFSSGTSGGSWPSRPRTGQRLGSGCDGTIRWSFLAITGSKKPVGGRRSTGPGTAGQAIAGADSSVRRPCRQPGLPGTAHGRGTGYRTFCGT